MATRRGSSYLALAALLALLAAARGSTLTVFDGNFDEGCTGNLLVISAGACSPINTTLQGGYYFQRTVGYGYFFAGSDCSGPAAKVLRDDVWHCHRFHYSSVYIRRDRWDITEAGGGSRAGVARRL